MKELTVLGLFLLAGAATAAERVNLTTPDQATPGTTTYRIAQISFDWEQTRVAVVLVGTNGERKEVVYGQNTGARGMMRALNKADFSTKSLHRQLMEKLLADGHLAGTISGAPD